jgi:hypothetical protein
LRLLQRACLDQSAIDPHAGPLVYNTGEKITIIIILRLLTPD